MRLSVLALSLPLAMALPYAAACHHDDEPSPALADVVFQGNATDEALESMLGLPSTNGDKRAAFTVPAAGAKLTEAPTFTWTFGAVAGSGRGDGGTGSLLPTLRREGDVRSRHRPDSPFVWGERAAHAHGDPMNGTGYLLVLSTPSDAKVLRVFTSQSSYKPDAAAWDTVKRAGAGATVSAVVTTALFDNNKVIANGGPYVGQAIQFEVAP